MIDVLMPPASLVLALLPALLAGNSVSRGLAVAGVGAMFVHYLVAAIKYGNLGSFLLLLFISPGT